MTPARSQAALAAILVTLAASNVLAQREGREPELLAPGVARFFPFGYPADAAPVSLALEKPAAKVGAVPESFRVKVAFSRGEAQIDPALPPAMRHAAVVPVAPGTSLYGTGEI